jgi:thiol:disulfide interchange protein DsbA
LLWVLTLSAAGCGRQAASGEHGKAETTPATALAPPTTAAAPAATVTERQEAGLAPTQAAKIARLKNEDGTESVDEPAGESGRSNILLAAVASTMASATTAAGAATPGTPPSPWVEGVNYTRLVPAQPTAAAPGQIEVLEFFWYGCPHCYAIDPLVESWRKTKAPYIAFSRVPVMWSPGHRATARLFYALESLGKLDQLHSDIFKEIHVNGDPLVAADPNDADGAERLQSAFVAKFGIPADQFATAYQSFAVSTDLQRADELGLRYRIEGVPTFIIDGKYVADVRSAGSPERLLALVTDLAAREHKH